MSALTCRSWVSGDVGTAENEDERDEAAGDVQPVEPGGYVEHRAVVARRQREALLPDQVQVRSPARRRSTGPSGTTVRTTGAGPSSSDRHRPGAPYLAPLDREHAHLQVTLTAKHGGVHRAKRDIQMGAWPGQTSALVHRSDGEVHREQRAKNISSEDSQTMVPTLTRLGLLAGERGVVSTVAVATKQLLLQPVGDRCATPRVGDGIGTMQCHEGRCVQPRRRCPGSGKARHRAAAGHGRAGRRDHRGRHGARFVPAA